MLQILVNLLKKSFCLCLCVCDLSTYAMFLLVFLAYTMKKSKLFVSTNFIILNGHKPTFFFNTDYPSTINDSLRIQFEFAHQSLNKWSNSLTTTNNINEYKKVLFWNHLPSFDNYPEHLLVHLKIAIRSCAHTVSQWEKFVVTHSIDAQCSIFNMFAHYSNMFRHTKSDQSLFDKECLNDYDGHLREIARLGISIFQYCILFSEYCNTLVQDVFYNDKNGLFIEERKQQRIKALQMNNEWSMKQKNKKKFQQKERKH